MEDKIAETAYENGFAASTNHCQVCGAPAKLCHQDLLQQAMYAIMGVATSTTVAALCAQCSSLAAQACQLHAQLQVLDDRLRRFHVKMLYSHLEQKGRSNRL